MGSTDNDQAGYCCDHTQPAYVRICRITAVKPLISEGKMQADRQSLKTKHRTLGLLAQPLGWLREPVSAALDHNPFLARKLIFLSRSRLHLVALAVAHGHEPYEPSLVESALTDSPLKVLADRLGFLPAGLRSVAKRIDQQSVLAREDYRNLVELMRAAKPGILLHCPRISDSLIQTLVSCPEPLRKFVTYTAAHQLPLRLEPSLHYLVKLGMADTVADLVARFAKFNRFSQVAAAVQQFVETLALPQLAGLPSEIGASRQLTTAAELRAIADEWCNCLRSYIEVTDNGTAALYLWKDQQVQALCLLERKGRMGWFLDHILGPQNADLAKDEELKIRAVFRNAGFESTETIYAITELLDFDTSKPHRHVLLQNGRGRFL
jgi:hypothetical protein